MLFKEPPSGSPKWQGSDPSQPQRVLILGDLARWDQLAPDVPAIFFHELDELDGPLLSSRQPDVIMSPLINRSLDAFEIAGRLAQLQFRGRYMIVADKLPYPDLVRGEISKAAPLIDVHVLAGSALRQCL